MNIYFSGIGGVAIGPLAQIAADADYNVQGSDVSESLMTHELEKRGVAIALTQDGTFLQTCHNETPIDWFVYTAALPADHPELLLATKLGIKTAKRDELLAHIIDEKNLKLIAIAGTHGKTTTTGMLIWTMQHLGIPISYSVGTTLGFGPSGKFDPASEYFIYECDEFDRNFLHFSPFLSLVTSVDFDHPDTYPNESDYFDAFREFGEKSKQIIAWQSEHGDLFSSHPDAWLLNETVTIPIAGEHNRRNATLVLKAFEKLDLDGNGESALENFPGTKRRFEKLADNLYSDYGHHPVEVAATLQLAGELSNDVVLVYQPHQNVRQHEIKNQYTADIFKNAQEIYWLPTYLSRENPDLQIIRPEELSQNLSGVVMADLDDTLWDIIQTARDNGKLVLCMGAGSIDAWVREQLVT